MTPWLHLRTLRVTAVDRNATEKALRRCIQLARHLAKAPRLAAKWRQLAEARCAAKGERLTPERLAVYAEMRASGRPLSAYELIALRERRLDRKIAPLTVYRHLDFLMRVGLVHRLQSAHSYLPCDHPDHPHESQFLVCTSCGHVDEVESKRVETLLSRIADQHGFRPDNAVVEINGLCDNCRGA